MIETPNIENAEAAREDAHPTVFQCECCLRYFRSHGDGAPELFIPQGHIGLPESFVCGLGDCGQIQAAIERSERETVSRGQRTVLERRQAIIQSRREKSSPKSKVQGPRSCRHVAGAPRLQSALGSAAKCLHSPVVADNRLAADTEPLTESPMSKVQCPMSSVGSSQREFLAAVDVGPAHAKLLQHFTKHYREWCALPVLEQVCGHHAVNSRCSELRDLIPGDHDIDQMNLAYAPTGKVHSHYRLCLKSESERIKRKERANEGQGELTQGHKGAEDSE